MISNLYISNKNKFFLFFLFIVFFVTNNYWGLSESINYGFPDFIIYEKISKCGYNFSIDSLFDLVIPEQFAERWVPNYIVGIISRITGIELLYIYRILITLIYFFLISIIYFSKYNLQSKILYFSTITFNPYTFRSYFAGAYNLNDCLFFFSVFLLAISLDNKKIKHIYIAIILGVIAKQTSIFFIPILYLFYLKKYINVKQLLYTIIFLLFFALSLKLSVLMLFKSMPSSTLRHIYGIFVWAFEEPKYKHLYLFFSRIFYFVILISPLVIIDFRLFIDKFYLKLAIFLLLQPILAGPAITADGGIRLYAFSLPFLYFPLLKNECSKQTTYLLSIIFLFISFHHNFSIIKYKNLYGLIIIFSLIFLFIYRNLYFKKVKHVIR